MCAITLIYYLITTQKSSESGNLAVQFTGASFTLLLYADLYTLQDLFRGRWDNSCMVARLGTVVTHTSV